MEYSVDIPLEDHWFKCEQEANSAHQEWQMLYRMKDHLISKWVKEAMELVKSKAAAEVNVKSSDMYGTYMEDMVNAEASYRKLHTISEHVKMKYFEFKASQKSEQQAYNHNSGR